MALKFYNSAVKDKTRSQKVLGASSWVCRSYRGKTDREGRMGRGELSPILSRVNYLLFPVSVHLVADFEQVCIVEIQILLCQISFVSYLN